MSDPTIRRGFEGQLFYGTAGATAATQLTKLKDITITRSTEDADTSNRGDGSTVPWDTTLTSSRGMTIEFVMLNDSSDADFAALMQIAEDCDGVALRGKDYATGKGPDADFQLSYSQPWPLKGEQVVTFTAKLCEAFGRAPQGYV